MATDADPQRNRTTDPEAWQGEGDASVALLYELRGSEWLGGHGRDTQEEIAAKDPTGFKINWTDEE